MSDYLDPNNEELLKDFFTEAQLMVETLEANLLVLENEPSNGDAVDEIFRAAHTLKGSAATVQMTELAAFTHLIEDLLDDIRSHSVLVTPEIIDALLDSVDLVKAMLAAREAGEPFSQDTKGLSDRLHSFQKGGAGAPARGLKAPAAKQSVSSSAAALEGGSAEVARTEASQEPKMSEYELLELREAAPPGSTIYQIRVGFNEDNPMNSSPHSKRSGSC